MDKEINKAPHYNEHPSGIECIDVVRHMNFNCGSIIKYIWRNGKKTNEDAIKDLKKAQFYINDEIKRLENLETKIPTKYERFINQLPDFNIDRPVKGVKVNVKV